MLLAGSVSIWAVPPGCGSGRSGGVAPDIRRDSVRRVLRWPAVYLRDGVFLGSPTLRTALPLWCCISGGGLFPVNAAWDVEIGAVPKPGVEMHKQ